MNQNKEVDQILGKRLKEEGTFVDGAQLTAFAKTAKSPNSSKKEKEVALRSLKTYVPNNDPFE